MYVCPVRLERGRRPKACGCACAFPSLKVSSTPNVCIVSQAYVGTGIHNIEDYVKGHESTGPIPVVLTVVGFVTAVVVFVAVAVYARKQVKKAAQMEELDPLVSPM